MKPQLGVKYLITTDNWFIAPDGASYRAVFGTVSSISTDNETLGIKTNRGSSNWYVNIGNMIVSGCQIHYCIQTDQVSLYPEEVDLEHEGRFCKNKRSNTNIYDADAKS